MDIQAKQKGFIFERFRVRGFEKNMKVLQISGAYVGAQREIERAIHSYLIQNGHESYVGYAYGNSDAEHIFPYENQLQNIVKRILRKYIRKTPRFARSSTRSLIKHIQKINPDLVHLHVIHHGYLDYLYLFKYLQKRNLPVVYTMHDMWAFTGGCYYYTKKECQKWRNLCEHCPALKTDVDTTLRRTSKELALKKSLFSQFENLSFIVVSEWVKEEMQKSFLANRPITVIENGLSLPVAQSCEISEFVKKEKAHKKTLLAVAATWDERKGIHRIFELAQKFGEAYEIFLVGSADEKTVEAAPANVRFLGYISNKNHLYALYREADLHISASLEETFGMTFVEAAMLGTRSVGFASTAITATLNGVYGCAVPREDVAEMAAVIRSLFESKKTSLTVKEQKTVIDQYSSETMAEKHFRVYQSVLAKVKESEM